MTRKISYVMFVLLLIGGCTKPADYLYEHPIPQHIAYGVQIKEFLGTNKLDILWVIDNSGSMAAHQQNVINNMDSFINTLSAASTLDWKSGLISTTLADQPYAGFVPGTELVSSDPQVSFKFRNAVAQLGTDGDGVEKMFDPTIKAISNYPNFVRPDAAFALIIISDAPEQSLSTDATTFLQYLTTLKGGLNNVYFYAFLNPVDWCEPTDDTWSWAGSPFEYLNTHVQGNVWKLCDPNFAKNLTNLGQNLGHVATSSILYLKSRPRVDTLKVFYAGKEIPSGPHDKGGYWQFNVLTNSIEFSDLSFAPGDTESVQIVYDVEDGTR